MAPGLNPLRGRLVIQAAMHVVVHLSAMHPFCTVILGCTGVLGLPVLSLMSQGGGGVGGEAGRRSKSFYKGWGGGQSFLGIWQHIWNGCG